VKAGLMAAAFLCGAFVLGLAVIAGGATGQDTSSAALLTVAQLATQTCTVSGPVGGLDTEQATDADLLVSAAMAATDENTVVARIAVMVAMTESGLRDLDYGDRDSLGLFQQRPSQGWGTPAQIMNPTFATDAFVQHLVAVPGWQAMPPWLAAQAVQRSAYQDGSNYLVNWATAGSIVAAVLTNGDQPGACGQGSGGLGVLPTDLVDAEDPRMR
jgi:hypothetical protein